MYDGVSVRLGLCDRCDHHEGGYDKLARELLGPDVLDDGGWVGGFSPDKSEKWNSALNEASKRLTKTCLVLYADCDRIALCKACVERLLAEFPQ